MSFNAHTKYTSMGDIFTASIFNNYFNLNITNTLTMMQSLEIKHETRIALHFRENYKKQCFKIKIRQSRKAKIST